MGRCKHCHIEFVQPARKSGRRQLFCSALCRRASHARYTLDKAKRYTQALPLCETEGCTLHVRQAGETRCKNCRNRYELTGSFAYRIACRICGREFRNDKRKVTDLCGDCVTASRRIVRTCEVCGKQFQKSRRYRSAGRACSRECGLQLTRDGRKTNKPTIGRRRSLSLRELIAERVNRWNGRRRAMGLTPNARESGFINGVVQMVLIAGCQCSSCGLAMSIRCEPGNRRGMALDHKTPLSKGGTDTLDNINVLCTRCNSLKGDRYSPEVILGQWPLSQVSNGQTAETN